MALEVLKRRLHSHRPSLVFPRPRPGAAVTAGVVSIASAAEAITASTFLGLPRPRKDADVTGFATADPVASDFLGLPRPRLISGGAMMDDGMNLR